MHASFDPHSPSFTLETLVDLRLDQHTDFIADLSINATKELSIENNIKVRLPGTPAAVLPTPRCVAE